MSQKNVYNLITDAEEVDKQNNKRDSDVSTNVPPASEGSPDQVPNAEDTVGVNVTQDAKTKAKKFTFKNLVGELELVPSRKNFDILAGSTIHVIGLGRYLSGFYHVASRSIAVSNSGAMTIKLKVIRSKFGDSLKGEKPLPETTTVDLIGDTDKAGNSTSVYDGAVDSGTINTTDSDHTTYKDGTSSNDSDEREYIGYK